jgi:aspartate aminotransferase-like enzyme
MDQLINNRLTGPTDLPPAVREALAPQMMSHRSAAFKEGFGRLLKRLKGIFNTTATPMVFTASGTGGMEAAIVNTLRRDARILAVSTGYYGELFHEIATHYVDVPVMMLASEPGQGVDFAALEALLKLHPFDAVLLTHGESSMGVMNDIAALSTLIRQHSEALILVDAVSSIGTTPFYMDKWGVDVAITVSQKGLMSPPGVTVLCASERALALSQRPDRIGGYYFHFGRALEYARTNETTSTPGILSIWGLEAALTLIEDLGYEAVFARHRAVAQQCQQGVEAAGYTLLAAPGVRFPGITSIRLPEGVSAEKIRAQLDQKFGVRTAVGVGRMQDQILRIGHMGWVFPSDIEAALTALRQVGP